MDDDFDFEFEESEDDFYTDFRHAATDGDNAMSEKRWDDAFSCYYSAWEILCEDQPEHQAYEAFWLVVNWANSSFMSGDFSDCLDRLHEALGIFRDFGLVVGNPFFHLRVGQCLFELAESDEERGDAEGQVIDNLSRALICGGIEIFDQEDQRYLAPVLSVLEPPEGYGSWQDARGEAGCSLDLLNDSTGFVRASIESKYSKALPFDE